MRTFRVADAVGTALVLNLCFVASALPVVTAFPAAVALQRQWTDHAHGRPCGVIPFARAFVTALRQSWPLGLFYATLAVAYVSGLIFWRQTAPAVAAVTTALLVGLGAVAIAFHIALLSVSARVRSQSWRVWPAEAGVLLLSDSPRYLLGTVAVVLAIVVIVVLPPLVLVLAGLVPAVMARWAARDAVVPQPAPDRT